MVKDREKYNAYMREYLKNRYYARRRQCIEILGGVCARCGVSGALDIDHITPSKKSFNVSPRWSKPWEQILEELKKCQLLCRKCHAQKGREDAGDPRHGSERHGTITCAKNYRCSCGPCRRVLNEYQNRYQKKYRERLKAGKTVKLDGGRMANPAVAGSNPARAPSHSA